MPRGKSPKRPRIAGPENLKTPRQIVPADQLAPFYGGDVGFNNALREARMAQTADRAELDPEVAALFPPVEHDNYNVPLTVQPAVGSVDAPGMYMNPEGVDPTVAANMRYGTEPMLPEEVSAEPLAQNQFSWLAENVERPITEGLLGDPLYNASDSGLEAGDVDSMMLMDAEQEMERRQMPIDPAADTWRQAIVRRTGAPVSRMESEMTPAQIDSTLAQLRRHGGDYGTGGFNPEEVLQTNMLDAMNRATGGESLGSEAIPKSGITLGQLIAMTQLPDNVMRFLPKRMNHLLGAGGAAAGMGMGQDPNRPTMNANYTTGPLSGLY